MNTPLAPARLAAPQAGASIQQIAGRWAHSVHDVYLSLISELEGLESDERPKVPQGFGSASGNGGETPTADPETALKATAAAIVSRAILALVHAPEVRTFEDADRWFFGRADHEQSVTRTGWPPPSLFTALAQLPWDTRSVEILPQVFEVLVTGPVGTSRHSNKARRNNRRGKRATGSFYTPLDVADYIAKTTVDDWVGKHTTISAPGTPCCLDPACGTGAFLLSCYDALARHFGRESALSTAADRVRATLFGIDIDRSAVQAARYVLLARALQDAGPHLDITPWEALKIFEANIVTTDATRVESRNGHGGRQRAEDGHEQFDLPGLTGASHTTALEELFPAQSAGFDIVLGNPPFSIRDQRGRRVSAYQPFVRMLWRFANARGSGGMVLPLALSYNRSQRVSDLRKQMKAMNGTWRISFFDRTPDSLFGDDVKTRNAIVLLSRGESQGKRLQTTGFLRWSSRERSRLFDAIQYQEVDWDLVGPVLPKLGSALEVEAYSRLRATAGRMSDAWAHGLRSTGPVTRTVQFGSTAYNWLPVFPPAFLMADESEGAARPGSWSRTCVDIQTAELVFVISSSRLAYWLWRVEGDGFHLPRWFVDSLPWEAAVWSQQTKDKLRALGGALWRGMQQRPVRSVNRGRASLSFSPLESASTLARIDRELCELYGLPAQFPSYLSQFHEDTISAGREDTADTDPKVTPMRTQ